MARQDIANMLTGMGGGSTRPNPNMSSSDWRMAFGAQQAQGLMNAAGTTTPQEAIQMGIGNLDLGTVEGLQTLGQMQQIRGDMAGAAQTVSQIKAMREKEAGLTAQVEDRTALADYLSQTYGEKGEAMREPVLRGQVTSSNFDKYINVSDKRTPKNVTYTDSVGNSQDQLVLFDEKGNTFDEQGNSLVLPDNAKLTTVGKTLQDVDQGVSEFTPKEKGVVRRDIIDSRTRIKQLEVISDEQVDKYLGYLGKAKAAIGRGLGQLTGLGGDVTNEFLENVTGTNLQEFAGEQGVLFGSLERYFNKKKHDVTGAAAAVAELKMLRKGILSGETSPSVAKAKLREIIGLENDKINVNFAMLQTGGLDYGSYFDEETKVSDSLESDSNLSVGSQEKARLIRAIIKEQN